MWYLASQVSDQKIWILSNKVFKIGRALSTAAQNPDLALSGDSSVSRLHAELLIKFTENQCADPETRPTIVLSDLSKFGTYVNDEKISEFKILNENDIIRFGMNQNYFKLLREPLKVTTSCVLAKNKANVRRLVCQLSGHIVNDYQNDCTHVIMDRLTSTVKVINALICQKHVVTTEYLEELIKTTTNGQNGIRPDPKKYLPPLSEDNLENISFEPNPVRKQLFLNKHFIFLSKSQMEKMFSIVELGKGQCSMFDPSKHFNQAYLKENDQLLFISSDEIDSEGVQVKLNSLLSGFNKRLIDDTEIGLAVLEASLNKYCNPWKSQNRPAVAQDCKIGSQTLNYTDMLEQGGSIRTDTQYNDMVLAAFETQDSAPFEYERAKINETVKVSNTPDKLKEKTRTRLALVDLSEPTETENRLEQSNIDTANNRHKTVIPDSPDQASPKKIPSPKKVQNKRKQLDVDASDEPLGKSKINLTNNKLKSIDLSEQENLFESFMSQANTAPAPNKTKKDVKKSKATAAIVKEEPVVHESDIKSTIKPTYTKTQGLVYSKLKPKNVIVKTETQAIHEPFQTSQLKVKFEKLILKQKTDEEFDHDSNGVDNGTAGKKNFKKFRKVPKKTAENRNCQQIGKFKAVKTEAFDLNSQFDSFLNSVR